MSINPNVDLTTYLNMEHPVKRAAVAGASTDKTATPAKADAKTAAKDGEGFSFRDLIDIVNPLQHIPIVSSIYREITGDKISNASRIVGGALYGGFIGAAVGGINAIAVSETGKDVGELAMNKLGFGHNQTDNPAAQVKSASAASSSAPTPSSSPASIPGSIPMIEVHPQAKAQTAPGFDAALNDPKLTAPQVAPQITSAKSGIHPLSNALQAQQFRHFNGHDINMPKMDADRAGLGLPQVKPVGDLKSVDGSNKPNDETASTDQAPVAPADIQQIPEDMMNNWVKYQQLKQSSNAEPSVASAMTAGDEAATN